MKEKNNIKSAGNSFELDNQRLTVRTAADIAEGRVRQNPADWIAPAIIGEAEKALRDVGHSLTESERELLETEALARAVEMADEVFPRRRLRTESQPIETVSAPRKQQPAKFTKPKKPKAGK